jgi:undecaprenyl-diphosphatase
MIIYKRYAEEIMEIQIIQWLQDNFFQWLIYLLSYIGHLFPILAFAAVLYLVVDKELGGKMLIFYFTSMLFNAFLKDWIRRPRPYLEVGRDIQIIENSTQYSMPSGHAQGFAALMVPLGQKSKTKKTYLICGLLLLFVCFTRVYLGQHYPSDVLAGAAIGIAIAVGLELVYRFFPKNAHLYLLALIPVTVALLSVFHFRDAYVSGGILIGSLAGIALEKRYLDYQIKGTFWNRVLKFLFSLAVMSVCSIPASVPLLLLPDAFFNPCLALLFAFVGFAITFVSPWLIPKVFDRNKTEQPLASAA